MDLIVESQLFPSKKVTPCKTQRSRELLKNIICLYIHVQPWWCVLIKFCFEMIPSLLKFRAESGLFQISHLSRTWTESMATTQSSFDLRNLAVWIFYQSPTHWSNAILWGFCTETMFSGDSCERHNEIYPGMDDCMTVVQQSWLQPP